MVAVVVVVVVVFNWDCTDNCEGSDQGRKEKTTKKKKLEGINEGEDNMGKYKKRIEENMWKREM